MIGIDTNILLRVLAAAGDNDSQRAAARNLLLTEAPVLLNPVVLAEFAWTLRRTYKLDRSAVHARLAGVTGASEFVPLFPEATRRAVDLYRSGHADFADLLIAQVNLDAGRSTTFTFDRAAAAHPGFTELTSA